MTKNYLMTLATTAALAIGSSAFAATAVENVPTNLTPADVLEAQLQPQNEANPAAPGAELNAQEDLRGGVGIEWGRPYPRPIPRPIPVPYRPYPGRLFTCYAQSPANGLTYSGTAYLPSEAENIALNTCFSVTGYTCVAGGCN